MSFHIGDKVVWTSQAAGRSKTKTGEVVAIVPEGTEVRDCVPDGMHMNDYGMPRKDVSYLILVQRKRSTKLYWPVASNLSKPE